MLKVAATWYRVLKRSVSGDMSDSPSVTSPLGAGRTGPNGPAVITVIYCNGDAFSLLPLYPVCPWARHSLSKYSSPSSLLFFSFHPPPLSWDILQTVMEFFLSSIYRGVMHSSNFCTGATGMAESLFWGLAVVQDGLETREGEGERERE